MTGRILRALAVWAVLLVAAWPPTAVADEIVVEDVFIRQTEEGHALSADFAFAINARLEEALQNGLTLYFLIEFQLERPRWYWFNDRTSERTQRIRLWYHALTRQYRVSTGALSQSFASLDEARRALARVRNWIVAERGVLANDTTYDCYLRMRLDVSQLPKPFQLTTLGNREWTLASEWKRWQYTPRREGSR
jgi:hypothetical protein